MSQTIESLPGFQTILDLADLTGDTWWISGDGRVTLKMDGRVHVPIRHLSSKTPLAAFRAGALTFLMQNLSAMTLGDLDSTNLSPSATLALSRFDRLFNSCGPGRTPLSSEQLADDLETFTELIMPSYLNALKQGHVDLHEPWPDTYKVALAYFGLRGLLSSIETSPTMIPKKKAQRAPQPRRQSKATATAVPVNRWIPSDIVSVVKEAATILNAKIINAASTELPVDVLHPDSINTEEIRCSRANVFSCDAASA